MLDLQALQTRIREAGASGARLRIRGGGSKDFYGGPLQGDVLDTQALQGVVDYEPTELVITARAGASLAEIQRTLAECGQFLPFEPPTFEGRATLGGAVASGLSGPRRAYCGALRDFVLGVRILDGRGEDLRFGGRVIKNVAGFDVARLMAGSLGTLGVITEVTLKTLPRPAAESTLRFEMDQSRALGHLNQWAGRPLPLSASAWQDGRLYLRLSGATAAVRAAVQSLGGDVVNGADDFWAALREQKVDFFNTAKELWRVSVPSNTPPLDVALSPSSDVEQASMLIEWGGALRWIRGPLDGAALRALVEGVGGHATLYRSPEKPSEGVFHPLPEALLSLHQRLKRTFDPHGILNPGRLYPNL